MPPKLMLAVAASIFTGCSGSSQAPASVPKPSVISQQLAAFGLRAACAREARNELKEELRGHGLSGAPTMTQDGSLNVLLAKAHYSLQEHNCYSVIDFEVRRRSFFTGIRMLIRVGRFNRQIAELDGTIRNSTTAFPTFQQFCTTQYLGLLG